MIASLAPTALFAPAQPGRTANQRSDLGTTAARAFRWSIEDRTPLTRLFSDASVVKRFLNEIVGKGPAPEYGNYIDHVKEYRLIDLRGDGWLELVALIDTSGREFCNAVTIISLLQNGALRAYDEFDGFGMQTVGGDQIPGLDFALRDIDKDGVYEIIVPLVLRESAITAEPNADIESVFAWDGYQYQKADVRFGDYFKSFVLPRLERERKALEAIDESRLGPYERRIHRLYLENAAIAIAEARKRASPQ